jgi:hypothetical protein
MSPGGREPGHDFVTIDEDVLHDFSKVRERLAGPGHGQLHTSRPDPVRRPRVVPNEVRREDLVDSIQVALAPDLVMMAEYQRFVVGCHGRFLSSVHGLHFACDHEDPPGSRQGLPAGVRGVHLPPSG